MNIGSENLNVTNIKIEKFSHLIEKCYNENISVSNVVPNPRKVDGLWCPRTFDGFACWGETPANATAFQECPSTVTGFDSSRFVYKECNEAGNWTIYPETQDAWTNYSSCVEIDDQIYRYIVKTMYVVGYSISIAALLLLTLLIFVFLRNLHCPRIQIISSLLISFALNNTSWIVLYITEFNTVGVENKLWCQFLHIITHYFMVASYFWMFCEALYLHFSLVVVFPKDGMTMRWNNLIGWGLSFVVTTLYATTRHLTGNIQRCWTYPCNTFWIIVIPVGIALLASFAILINVVRVLLALKQVANQRAYLAGKKTAKATFLLVPLFSLHFILISLRPTSDMAEANIYQVMSAVITSLQGLCIAVLFCFTNHDVTAAIRAQIAKLRRTNDDMPMTGPTGRESQVKARETII